MAGSLTSATIVDVYGRHDVAVPTGTSLGGLLDHLGIDHTPGTLVVADNNGKTVDLDDVFGSHLPPGSLLTITRGTDTRQAEVRAITEATRSWFHPVLGLVAAFGILIVLEATLVAEVWLAQTWAPAWLRWALAALCLALSLALLARRRVWTSPWLCPPTTACVGLAVAGLLTPDALAAASLLPTLAAWGALMGALLAWTLTRGTVLLTAAYVWAGLAITATVQATLGVPWTQLAPFVQVLATVGVTVAPQYTFRVPDSQLLDLPLVTTSAPTVRAPAVVAPAPITHRRVERSLREATARGQVLLLFCCTLVAVTALLNVQLIGLATWAGRAALALQLACLGVLLVTPRHHRERGARALPRLTALVLVLATALGSPLLPQVGAATMGAMLVVAACGVCVGTVLHTAKPTTPLFGRFLDLVEAFSLLTLLPAASLAAGLFTLVRQVMS
ncbi:hypothetical protein EII12_08555 [Buchananella hordeovulneris]|uniref:hypothetical protein n=1 Tax=Buchananella hordeovulneris TaxID=52770 RepID=UPI000F5E5373|nr:hypothetical protein [Buchananella hordeovulneris]RRD51277.1 hypothetical protein EII12_08555 [Buchananella hordeovulneris]